MAKPTSSRKKQKILDTLPIDPTKNVMSLVAASNLRQDDLRGMSTSYQEKIDALRDHHHRELAAAESKRIDAVILAESRRVDALLGAQSQSVALASEKAAAQAATLATQVTANAENVRSQTASLRDSLESRIKVIEQNQYQAGGAQSQKTEGTKANQWIITLIVGVVMTGIGIVVTVMIATAVFFLSRMWPVH